MATYIEWLPDYERHRKAAVSFDFAAESRCSYFDLLYYPSSPEPIQTGGDLDSAMLRERLAEGNPSFQGEEPNGGIRLLLGVCGYNPEINLEMEYGKHRTVVPFEEAIYACMQSKIGLPKRFLETMVEVRGPRAFKFSNKGPVGHTTCFVFKFTLPRPSFYHLALSYNQQSKVTHGLLLSKTRDHHFRELIQWLQSSQNHRDQPLGVALHIAEIVIETCADRVNASDSTLNDLEEEMDQHQYPHRPRGNPLELDFIATTRAINSQSRKLGLDLTRLEGAQLAVALITEGTNLLTAPHILDTAAVTITVANNISSDSSCSMNEASMNLANLCKNTLTRLEYEMTRCQTLIAVVYQFMAQKDSRINIQHSESSAILARASKEDSQVMRTIAIESKKDSSAMKTIAILTMLFLPGTFLAAIFAMPFFNWGVDGESVVKSEFRIYWAFAIPLTVMVVLIWAVAVMLPWKRWLSGHQPTHMDDFQCSLVSRGLA
ncbi:uncharacterized protein PAC_18847 [Phialocephala subalpina]|uniref:Uncharacterized protein n=1 Tax=Phialocephala subalpina TaxID=576137 RepID=A0A1L7XV79_9HELO|nr:uncharacterized protein PAC_18847 [Phialocephala subalpina]